MIIEMAVFKRGRSPDVLGFLAARFILLSAPGIYGFQDDCAGSIFVTSSISWRSGNACNRFPQHQTPDIRGNVQTRLLKL